jgi:methionyl-tRNA formyltransferase
MILKDSRIVFIGESRFSREMLTVLLEHGYNIVGIFSRPIKEGVDDCDDLADICPDITHWTARLNINDRADVIRYYEPDFIFCLGFRQIIKKPILDICPVIGYHPSPLPKGRGHSPIVWALVEKWEYTASTFFLMDEGVDSGDILSKISIKIKQDETVKSLYDKLIYVAKWQILNLHFNNRRPQDHSQATYLRKRIKGQEDTWLEY